ADPMQVERNAEAFYSENIAPGSTARIVLQPMLDIHFNTDLQNEMSTRDDITGLIKGQRQRSDIFIFSGVAVLTLVIAAFNFMNLQAVQLSRRSREIGVKRIAGSSRAQLVTQFQMETLFIALAAFLISLILCELFMPLFNTMVASTGEAESFFTPFNVSVLLVTALAVGLVAGAYPSITAARLSPSNVLRGDVVNNSAVGRFRSGLIVAQFSISIGLIVAAGIVNTQIEYAMNKSLGFDPDNIITVELPNTESRSAYPVLRDQLLQLSGVEAVSAGSVIPTRDLSDGRGWVVEGGDPSNAIPTRWIRVDDDYFETLGMEFIAGRPLSDDFPSDRTIPWSQTVTSNSGGIVLNETAFRLGGWASPAGAIGDRFITEFEFNGTELRNEATVVGIVADAHFESVRTDMAPLSFTLEANGMNVMMVKISGEDQVNVLEQVDRIWRQQIPEYPIQRAFLSESYRAFYAGENRTFGLFVSLSAVAVAIACLGLYSLASFIAERRTKEISIRKVLGATVRSIAGMLAWDFSKLVVVANVIAWPLAWWSMQQWLSNFAYRTEVNLMIFLLAGLATFVLAMITTFQKTYNVASVNPVVALKTE
ncbi:MAG: FtsX-like permease family protein, partial [Pseudomonadales bacterium]|nr:FtsX-like permease family protein [Pseudomonadales bacterium]